MKHSPRQARPPLELRNGNNKQKSHHSSVLSVVATRRKTRTFSCYITLNVRWWVVEQFAQIIPVLFFSSSDMILEEGRGLFWTVQWHRAHRKNRNNGPRKVGHYRIINRCQQHALSTGASVARYGRLRHYWCAEWNSFMILHERNWERN